MIAIVDYGVGNLFSLSSSVRSLGAEVRVTHEAADLNAASLEAAMSMIAGTARSMGVTVEE